jgi:hypothetical protein
MKQTKKNRDEEYSPRGPNDVRMMFATVRAAKMCVCCTKEDQIVSEEW